MIRCTFCDQKNPITATRCSSCGAELPGAHERGEPAPRAVPAASDFDVEILALLRAGRKIEAIKLQRERTGSGLAEAKQAVETLAAAHGVTTPASGCAGMLVALLLALLVGGLLLVVA
jgi:ribosomal protein L7/L12